MLIHGNDTKRVYFVCKMTTKDQVAPSVGPAEQQQAYSVHIPTLYAQSAVIKNCSCSRKYDDLCTKAVFISMSLHIAMGISSILFTFVLLPFYGFLVFYSGYGIYFGIFFIVTGTYGIKACRRKTLCPILTFMILSIISASMAIVLLSFGALRIPYYEYEVVLAMESLMIITSSTEFVVAIVSACLSCHAICGCSKEVRQEPHHHIIQSGCYSVPLEMGQIQLRGSAEYDCQQQDTSDQVESTDKPSQPVSCNIQLTPPPPYSP